jgi:hypothetical protein
MFEKKQFEADIFDIFFGFLKICFIKLNSDFETEMQEIKQKAKFNKIRNYLTEKLFEDESNYDYFPNKLHINPIDWNILNKLHLNEIFKDFEITLKVIDEPIIFYDFKEEPIQVKNNLINKTIFLQRILE